MRTVLGIYGALFIFCSIGVAQTGVEQEPLMSLVQTEQDFARTSVAKGIRESFLSFFADDGIVFRPHPVRYKEAVANTPPPTNPLAVTLNWEPLFADVARSGDLGYTTGPYMLTVNTPEKRQPQYGFFFSVWKKQTDGNWRVVLDAGIQTSEPYSGPTTFQRAPQPVKELAESRLETGKGKEMLLNAERELMKAAATDGFVKALLARISNDVRVYRQGLQPVIGFDSVRSFLLKKPFTQLWRPMKADAARSSDLGYTYGSYETRGKDAAAIMEKGYYVRVWKRAAEDRWVIVFDVALPLPPNESESN
jgi:ketosteroid isomerase-like protein